ncbi:MAG: M81 family metallopeptidase [Proteobacteria bacterium]|nr:M81 family metallopeptidase [Pseudomonadota bacterium]MBI3498192.1 M81 family metallopeptidase [Pseudomonadota bacterium]
MRLFTAMIATETNTFSPLPAGLKLYEECYLVRGGRHLEPYELFALPLVRFRDHARKLGWQVVESLATFAQPAAATQRIVYEDFRDEVLEDLRRAMPVDVVLLNLHGAMVAEGYEDCEGDLLTHIRAIVGRTVPIGVELDLHCHLTDEMVAASTAMVIYKEYPHTDIGERADDLFRIILDALEGRTRPSQALFDCRTIGLYPTTVEPMQSFVQRFSALEGRNGVLSVSVGHGFPWADVREVGSKVLVVTDGREEEAARLAEQLGRELYAMREAIEPPWLELGPALDRMAALLAGTEKDTTLGKGSHNGPVVVADVADNAGGGAPSDSTPVLRGLLARGIASAAVGCFWDASVVEAAEQLGAGGRLAIRLGGKIGPVSGDPIDLQVRVIGVTNDLRDTLSGASIALGRAAAFRIEGTEIDLVANTTRCQVFTPAVFSRFGIDVMAKQVVSVKSMNHFRAGFAPIARGIVYAAAPGCIDVHYRRLPYKNVRRPIWPLDAKPWG